MLCLIGEAFGEHSDEVCGAVVNIRNKGDKVGVWTSNGANAEGTKHIGFVNFNFYQVFILFNINA